MTFFIWSLLGMLLTACTGTSAVKQELMDVDIQFSRMSDEMGMNQAFGFFVAEEGILLRPNAAPYVGKQAVLELLSGADDSEFSLTWEPLDAMISESGDLGFTYGMYTFRTGESESRGTYVTIWKKDPKGQWKFVLDSGNEGLGN